MAKNWGFDIRDADTSVRPQDDFFHFAGGEWIKRTKVPTNESRWGSFMILRKNVDKQVHEIVRNEKGVARDFFRSGLDMKRRNALGLQPLAPHFKIIESMKNVADIVPALAKLEKLNAGGIWSVFVDQDMKNAERYLLNLAQGGLGMPDRDYYLKDDKDSVRVREAYKKHLAALFTLSKLPGNAEEEVTRVFAIEHALAKISMRKEDLRDPDKVDHKHSLVALKKLAKGIDWEKYFHTIGARNVKEVNVCQPKFIAALPDFFMRFPLRDWQMYLRLHVIQDFSGALSEPFIQENFAFYGTTLTGQTEMRPLWRRVLTTVGSGLGEYLGKRYVERHFSPLAKKQMLEMVSDLFAAYETRIKELDWMSEATRKKALKKLSQIKVKIGYPNKWKSYAGLLITPNDYVGNIMRVSTWHARRELRKLGKKVDRSEWFMYPHTVNAYYSPSMNDIVFPAGILQPPFFSPQADDAINYGAIGSVIGHEITHGFDDSGAKFDGFGNRKSWWTPRDRKLFEKKAKVLVKQFNEYTVADGVKVNGQLTLGENIADLGGMSIAYDAYLLKLARTGRKDISGLTPEQRFFLGASLFEREISRPEFQKMQVTTDPHSPAIFRVNGPLSNLPEFYKAFEVKSGDKLYRDPKARAKIW